MISGRTAAGVDIAARMEADSVDLLLTEFCDFIGVSRCRAVRRSFISREGRPSFPYVNIAHNLGDGEPDPSAMGPNSSSFWLEPDPGSYRRLPYMPDAAGVICNLKNPDGTPYGGCVRSRAQAVVDAFERRGLQLRMSFEPEGNLLVRSPDRAWVAINRTPIFSHTRIAEQGAFIERIFAQADAMGLPLEKVSAEAAGTIEFNLPPRAPIAACDDWMAFRALFKAVAREFGWLGTFTPRATTESASCGLHVHLSVTDAEGRDALANPVTGEFTPAGREMLAGIMEHASAVVAASCNSVNSYRRLVPGNSWAPTYATWGMGNRSALVRVVDDPPYLLEGRTMPPIRRLEFRAPDGTCNPYVVVTALLSAMLDGADHHHPLEEEGTEDYGRIDPALAVEHGVQRLPPNLDRALEALRSDEVICEAVGPVLVRGILKARQAEWDEYHNQVTAWEQERFFGSY